MSRLHRFLADSRVLSAIGVAALCAFVLLGARALQLAMVWAFAACGLIALAWGAVWLLRRFQILVTPELIGQTYILRFFAEHSPMELITSL